MLNCQQSTEAATACQDGERAGALAAVIRNGLSALVKTTHHTILVVGIMAIGTLGFMFVRPDVMDHLKSLSPYAAVSDEENTEADEEQLAALETPEVPGTASSGAHTHAIGSTAALKLSEEDINMVGNSRQQERVTSWLSRRYRVASDATNMLVSAAYLTAKEIKLDPLLILSVIAIESRFNPFAESPVGAQGLMQVMSKVHRDKFEDHGGVKAALNPVANIKVGALILKEYVQRTGSVEAGLKLYVGAGAMEDDSGYGAKVLAEYNRLKDVAMGKKVSIFSTSASAASQKNRQQENKAEAANQEEAPSASRENRKNTESEKMAAL